MNSNLKDILLITNYDWRDSFGSKRILFLFAIYLSVALLSTLLFISMLHTVESEVAKEMGLAETNKTGTLTSTFKESETFKRIVFKFVDDEQLANKILKIPTIPLFYGWLSFVISPFLVILLSSESISRTVSTGYIRFNIFRTSRFAWVAGKGLSQAMMLFFALLLGAAGVFVVGWIQMSTFDLPLNAWFLLVFTLKGWVFSLPFLGIALAVSQCVRSVYLSLFLGIVSLMTLTTVYWTGTALSGDGFSQIWDFAISLTPQSYRFDLMIPVMSKNITAGLYLLGLTCLYFFSGYFIFTKRDL